MLKNQVLTEPTPSFPHAFIGNPATRILAGATGLDFGSEFVPPFGLGIEADSGNPSETDDSAEPLGWIPAKSMRE